MDERRRLWIRRGGAVASCALITAGCVLGGMDKAASAALFAAVLALVLVAALLATPRSQLARTAKMHAVPLCAGAAFILWSLFTAWLEPVAAAPGWRRALFHPLWATFDSTNAAVSIAPYRTLEGVAAFIGPAAAFLLGAILTQDRRDRDFLGRLFIAAAASVCVAALYLLVTGAAANNNRLMAPFGSSNAAATLFGVFAIAASALILRAARSRLSGTAPAAGKLTALRLAPRIPVSLGVLALTLACLLLTGSRAGLACFAGGLVLFFALTRGGAPQGGRGQAGVAIVALVAAILLLIGGDFLLSRFGTFGVDAEGRRLMIETHWGAFLDRPLTGHGLNTFHELNTYYATVETWPALRNIGAAHNIFVQMLEENGLVGAALFMLMLAPPLSRALQIAVEARSGSEWAAAAFAAAAFVCAHGLVDFGLQVPSIAAALAYLLGAYSSSRLVERKPTPPTEPDPRAPMRFRPPPEQRAAA